MVKMGYRETATLKRHVHHPQYVVTYPISFSYRALTAPSCTSLAIGDGSRMGPATDMGADLVTGARSVAVLGCPPFSVSNSRGP